MLRVSVSKQLIVAVDTLKQAKALLGAGVCIKIETLMRREGLRIVTTLMRQGFNVFADLKLSGTPHTLKGEGEGLRHSGVSYVTVMCSTGVSSMRALKQQLPDVCVLGVTVLTSMTEKERKETFPGFSPDRLVLHFADLAEEAGLDGVVASPGEIKLMREQFPRLKVVTPNIRPQGWVVEGDDQNLALSMTPSEALEAGASAIILGRPIVGHTNPKEAVRIVLADMASVVHWKETRSAWLK